MRTHTDGWEKYIKAAWSDYISTFTYALNDVFVN